MALYHNGHRLAIVKAGRLYVYAVGAEMSCIASDDFAGGVQSVMFLDQDTLATCNGTQTQLFDILR